MEVQGQVAAEAALPHAIAGRAGETPGEAELEDGQRYQKLLLHVGEKVVSQELKKRESPPTINRTQHTVPWCCDAGQGLTFLSPPCGPP